MTENSTANDGKEIPEEMIREVEKTIDDGKNIAVEEGNKNPLLSDLVKGKKLDFPCDYQISVMGQNCEAFIPEITAAIKTLIPELKEADMSHTLSSGNKYISLRVPFMAQSQAQLDALYKKLAENKLVKWVL